VSTLRIATIGCHVIVTEWHVHVGTLRIATIGCRVIVTEWHVQVGTLRTATIGCRVTVTEWHVSHPCGGRMSYAGDIIQPCITSVWI